MVDVLWWLQAAGAVISLLLSAGALFAAAWATFRDTPSFVRRLIGISGIEKRLDRLLIDHATSQELQLQQAEEFNRLADQVGEEHNVPVEERPFVNPDKIREHLLDDETPDFTRGGGRGSRSLDD